MLGKYFFHKEKVHFYHPGEEIKFGRGKCVSEQWSLNSVKARVVFSAVAFCCVYLVLAIRLFDLCVLQVQDVAPTTDFTQDDEFTEVLKFASNPIKS